MSAENDFIREEKARIRKIVSERQASHAWPLPENDPEILKRIGEKPLAPLREIVKPYLTAGDTEASNAPNVLTFESLPDEVWLGMFNSWLYSQGANVILPRMNGPCELTLHIRHADSKHLREGPFGVLEPHEDAQDIDPHDIDIVLVPGVAFTKNGKRLGRGKGYYDALLAKLRPDAITIGVCFTFQVFEDLPTEKHDKNVSQVVAIPPYSSSFFMPF